MKLPSFLHQHLCYFSPVYTCCCRCLDCTRSPGSLPTLVLAAPMFMLVGCAFLAYHLEGRQLRWPDVRDRFRLRRMGLDTWLWTAALAIFMFGGRYASLAAFILVLLALGLDRSAGLKRRVKMAFGAAVLALSWVIWQAQPILGRIAHSVANSGFLIQIVQGIVRS